MKRRTETCPGCGSDRVAGLVAAFWVDVNKSPDDVKWNSESEVTEKRTCLACDREWNDGEEEAPLPRYLWGKPANAKRYHVFQNGLALCGSWLMIPDSIQPVSTVRGELIYVAKRDCLKCVTAYNAVTGG